jgi:D-alanyl-D-alanine carboxypeptidase
MCLSQRWDERARLLDWAFQSFQNVKPAIAGYTPEAP